MKNMLMLLQPRSGLFFKTELEYWLAVSILFSAGLVFAGSIFIGTFIFGFLLWNLFLGFIPYAISKWMQRNINWDDNKLKFCLGFVIWLLFIPNSFYILTDLFHLGSFDYIPSWFELAVILSFAWNGLVLGILSVRQIEKLIRGSLSNGNRLLFIYPVMFLNALGIYIGRYMRFNSWDVIANPFHLLKDISDLAMHPLEFRYAWGMIICFSVFLTLMFLTLTTLRDANVGRELARI